MVKVVPLLSSLSTKMKYPKGQEAVDVCVAIQEMVADGETRGRISGEIKGTIETYREVDFSLQETIQRVAEKLNLSL